MLQCLVLQISKTYFLRLNYIEKNTFQYNKDMVMKFTAVIPVKAHSSRLPGKNLKPFGKENLLTRKIRQLKQSQIADRIILSSDSDEMLDIATKHGIEAIKRPIEFANESRPFGEFLDYISEIIKEGHMIYSCVTSPFFDENLMVKAK